MTVDKAALRELLVGLPLVAWSKTRSTVTIPETEDFAGTQLSITGLDKQYARRLAAYIAATNPLAVSALLDENEALRKQNDGLREQHDRDSRELRSLCQARDDARRTVDRWKARLASRNKELGALKHDIGEYVRISGELATENGRLREALEEMLDEYGGRHDSEFRLKDHIALEMIARARAALEPAPPQGDGA